MDLQAAYRTITEIGLPHHTSIGWEVRRLVARFPNGVRVNTLVWCLSDLFNITDFKAREVICLLLEKKLIFQSGWYIYNQ